MRARPHGASSSRAPERDLLLATKLHVPQTRPDLLSRPRLLDRLEEGASRGLLLVSVPAGFGTSTLLAQWAGSSKRQVAWLALDPDDNDPARFWRYLVAAIEHVHPGLQEKVLPLLAAADQWTSDAIVATLGNELATRPAELTIVRDDYHAIESEAIHKSLGVLLEHLPAGMQVVIAGRSDPPVPLARMRARGQVAELRADDLRFTTDEAAALLGKVWGLQLSDESIAVLTNRTEGWVTGFQLAALSLRDRADAAEFIRGFSGSHRFVLDYLTEEVLEHQPDRVRRFLVDTSILERLTGSLSDAVTGGSDGQEMLEDLERANIFLVALDEERRWYRYHGLFADLLRARLEDESPERVAELHQKAAGWYEANGLIREAVRHALAAGEPARAAELVESNVDDVLGRGEGASLRRWLSALPHDVVRSPPRLAAVQALAAFTAGRLEAVEPLLNDAEHALTQPGVSYDRAVDPQSALTNVPALIANLRSSLAIAQGDAERARSYAAKALVLSAGEHGPALSVRWNMTTADWLEGRMADAERAFSEIVAEGKATGIPHLTLSAGAYLGRVLQAEGRLGAAWRIYEEGLDAAIRAGRPVIPTAGSAHIGMAEGLYQRDRLDEALHHVNEGITLSRQLTSTQPLASGLSMLAWIRQAKGDTLGALQAMEEARRAYPNADMVSLINPVPAEMARLMIAHNDLRGAAAWLDERGVDEKDEPTYPREREYLVLARLLLAREFPGRALDLLARVATLALAQGRTASVIEVKALQALGLHAAGDQPAARATLTEALVLTQPEDSVRAFVDAGPGIAALLSSIVGAGKKGQPTAGQVDVIYLGRLLRAVRSAATEGGPPKRGLAPLVETLTDREFEILRMLAAGKQNQEIANELCVTLDTVKKHLTHTFGKLGAANRTQAVARARQLGLID